MPRQRRVTYRIKLKRKLKDRVAMVDGSPMRPVVADRIAALPIDGRGAHRVEDAAPGRRQLGHLWELNFKRPLRPAGFPEDRLCGFFDSPPDSGTLLL